jgi:hypothetical protein
MTEEAPSYLLPLRFVRQVVAQDADASAEGSGFRVEGRVGVLTVG